MLLRTLSALEVKDVGLDCTEGVIIANVEPICVLHLTGLGSLLHDRDPLRWRLLNGRLRLRLSHTGRLVQQPRNRLGLIEIKVRGFPAALLFFSVRATREVQCGHKLVDILGLVERVRCLRLRDMLRCYLSRISLFFILTRVGSDRSIISSFTVLLQLLLLLLLLGKLLIVKDLELSVFDLA